MELSKTILGNEIPESTRSIFYLCKYDYTFNTIEVIGERMYDNQQDGLETYANVRNPESQLVSGDTYEKLIAEMEQLHKSMKDEDWLIQLSECL